MIQNVDDLKDPMLWEKFEKDVEDFTIEEVRKFRFKSLELCGEFYKFYAKIKGFGVRGEWCVQKQGRWSSYFENL